MNPVLTRILFSFFVERGDWAIEGFLGANLSIFQSPNLFILEMDSFLTRWTVILTRVNGG